MKIDWTNRDPTEDGIYIVRCTADEGEDYAPADWTDIDEWKAGHWDTYPGHVVERSLTRFATAQDAAEMERRLT